MRIRSLKPEFWSSEDTAKLSDFAKLIAIGLITMADDEGYFNANPTLIENTLFPINPPKGSVVEALDELLADSFVELFATKSSRTYGRVKTFVKHQKIDRAHPSKIAPLLKDSKKIGIAESIAESFHESFVEEIGESFAVGSGIRDQGSGITPLPPTEESGGDSAHKILKARPELSALTWEQDLRARQSHAEHPKAKNADWDKIAEWTAGEALLAGHIKAPGAWLRTKYGQWLDGVSQKKNGAPVIDEARPPRFAGRSANDP